MRRLIALSLLALLAACGATDSDNDPDVGIDSGADAGLEVQTDQPEGIGVCGYCTGTVADPVWTRCREPVPLGGESGPDEDGACQCQAIGGERFPGGGDFINCVPDVSFCPCMLSGGSCEWPTSTYHLEGFPLCGCQGDSCTESIDCSNCD